MEKWILVLTLGTAACHAPESSKPRAEPAAEVATTIEVVPLKFAVADQVAIELRSVIEGQKSKRSMRVVADSRTNSIILSGPRDDIAPLLELISKLDVKQS